MIEEERMVGVDMHDKQGEMVINFREMFRKTHSLSEKSVLDGLSSRRFAYTQEKTSARIFSRIEMFERNSEEEKDTTFLITKNLTAFIPFVTMCTLIFDITKWHS